MQANSLLRRTDDNDDDDNDDYLMKLCARVFILQHGLTPLHVATHYNNDKVATFLLDNNADPNAQAKVKPCFVTVIERFSIDC